MKGELQQRQPQQQGYVDSSSCEGEQGTTTQGGSKAHSSSSGGDSASSSSRRSSSSLGKSSLGSNSGSGSVEKNRGQGKWASRGQGDSVFWSRQVRVVCVCVRVWCCVCASACM